MRIKLISWNLNNRTRAGAQLDLLLSRRADFLILQEVNPARAADLSAYCEDRRLFCMSSLAPRSVAVRRRGHKALGLLVVSRFPIARVALHARAFAWPEKILGCRVRTPSGPVYLVGAHVPPGSSNGWAKVEVLETLYDFIFGLRGSPVLVAGDMNTPREELEDGRVVTWAQRVDAQGRVRNVSSRAGDRGGRWDRAERSIVQGLPALGLADAFRSLHGYSRDAASWRLRRRARSSRVARRYDHVFASEDLNPLRCCYIDEPGVRALSDHLPIEAVFRWPLAPRVREPR